MRQDNKKDIIENEYPSVPRPAVGVVVKGPGGRILMVKRGKPPAEDLWSVPGGSIELGETIFQCAEREVLEETGIRCQAFRVCDAIDAIYRDEKGIVRFHYVIVYVLARYQAGTVFAGDDAVDAGWFSMEEIGRMNTPGRTVELIKRSGCGS
jgi:ADP-ribose pyrophosphatase